MLGARRRREMFGAAQENARHCRRVEVDGDSGVVPWGIVSTSETYKNSVKLSFAKRAMLDDPSRLLNSSLDGKVRRAINIHEGYAINEAALKKLIRAAVARKLKSKPKPRETSSKP